MARLIFAVLTLLTAVLIQPGLGQAAPYWPWCARLDTKAHYCAFISWEQCMDTVRGIGGYCYVNPYGPPLAPLRPAKSNHRVSRG
jgi:hypothetical protein